MFAPAGWISLRDVHEYFVQYFSENETLGEFTFTGDEIFELSWYFANEAEQPAACSANGVVIPISRSLLQYENECSHANFHVNLLYGTIGSGEVLERKEFPCHAADLDAYLGLLYGPFRGLPVIFKKDDFEGFLQRMYPDFSEGNISIDDDHAFVLRSDQSGDSIAKVDADQEMSPRAVSKRILAAWRSNGTMVRDEIKELVAPSQSHRKFLLAWGLAAQDEPAITNPGRRKGKS